MAVIGGVMAPPIEISDVYSMLGIDKYNGTYDIGYACSNQHGKINSNSLYKPISHNRWPGELSDEDYFSANFGYNVISFNSYTAMRDGVDTRWGYIPPTSNYRITDFNRYVHGETSPFSLTVHNNPALNSKCFVTLRYAPSWFSKWQAFAADFQGGYLNCGFYVVKSGMTYYQLTGPNLKIEDINEQHTYIVPNVTFEVGDTYQMYFVFTTWASGNSDHMWAAPGTGIGKWWVLNAGEPASFRVLSEIRPIDKIEVSASNSTIILSRSNNLYYYSNIKFDMLFKNTYNVNVSVRAEIYVNNTTSGRIQLATMSAESIAPTGTYTFHVSYSGTLEYTVIGMEVLTVQIVMYGGSFQRTAVVNVPATVNW